MVPGKGAERPRQRKLPLMSRSFCALRCLAHAEGIKVENDLSNMTDEQLMQRIKELDAAIAAELGNAARVSEGDGETEPSGTKH